MATPATGAMGRKTCFQSSSRLRFLARIQETQRMSASLTSSDGCAVNDPMRIQFWLPWNA
jgi:hypothetical protein